MRLACAAPVLSSAFAALLTLATAAPAAPPRTVLLPTSAIPPLALNEILAGPARDWDGSGAFSSRDDEWIEVVNLGDATLDLAGFLVTDGDSIPRYAFAGALAPHARQVVFGKQSYDWEKAHAYPAFGLSLGNSGDAALLWYVNGIDTTLVDSYAYKSHEAAADRAIGRQPDGTGVWALFDGLNPYTGATPPQGNGCNPTPNDVNLCATTPTRTASWGRVKTLYR